MASGEALSEFVQQLKITCIMVSGSVFESLWWWEVGGGGEDAGRGRGGGEEGGGGTGERERYVVLFGRFGLFFWTSSKVRFNI